MSGTARTGDHTLHNPYRANDAPPRPTRVGRWGAVAAVGAAGLGGGVAHAGPYDEPFDVGSGTIGLSTIDVDFDVDLAPDSMGYQGAASYLQADRYDVAGDRLRLGGSENGSVLGPSTAGALRDPDFAGSGTDLGESGSRADVPRGAGELDQLLAAGSRFVAESDAQDVPHTVATTASTMTAGGAGSLPEGHGDVPGAPEQAAGSTASGGTGGGTPVDGGGGAGGGGGNGSSSEDGEESPRDPLTTVAVTTGTDLAELAGQVAPSLRDSVDYLATTEGQLQLAEIEQFRLDDVRPDQWVDDVLAPVGRQLREIALNVPQTGTATLPDDASAEDGAALLEQERQRQCAAGGTGAGISCYVVLEDGTARVRGGIVLGGGSGSEDPAELVQQVLDGAPEIVTRLVVNPLDPTTPTATFSREDAGRAHALAADAAERCGDATPVCQVGTVDPLTGTLLLGEAGSDGRTNFLGVTNTTPGASVPHSVTLWDRRIRTENFALSEDTRIETYGDQRFREISSTDPEDRTAFHESLLADLGPETRAAEAAELIALRLIPDGELSPYERWRRSQLEGQVARRTSPRTEAPPGTRSTTPSLDDLWEAAETTVPQQDGDADGAEDDELAAFDRLLQDDTDGSGPLLADTAAPNGDTRHPDYIWRFAGPRWSAAALDEQALNAAMIAAGQVDAYVNHPGFDGEDQVERQRRLDDQALATTLLLDRKPAARLEAMRALDELGAITRRIGNLSAESAGDPGTRVGWRPETAAYVAALSGFTSRDPLSTLALAESCAALMACTGELSADGEQRIGEAAATLRQAYTDMIEIARTNAARGASDITSTADPAAARAARAACVLCGDAVDTGTAFARQFDPGVNGTGNLRLSTSPLVSGVRPALVAQEDLLAVIDGTANPNQVFAVQAALDETSARVNDRRAADGLSPEQLPDGDLRLALAQVGNHYRQGAQRAFAQGTPSPLLEENYQRTAEELQRVLTTGLVVPEGTRDVDADARRINQLAFEPQLGLLRELVQEGSGGDRTLPVPDPTTLLGTSAQTVATLIRDTPTVPGGYSIPDGRPTSRPTATGPVASAEGAGGDDSSDGEDERTDPPRRAVGGVVVGGRTDMPPSDQQIADTLGPGGFGGDTVRIPDLDRPPQGGGEVVDPDPTDDGPAPDPPRTLGFPDGRDVAEVIWGSGPRGVFTFPQGRDGDPAGFSGIPRNSSSTGALVTAPAATTPTTTTPASTAPDPAGYRFVPYRGAPGSTTGGVGITARPDGSHHLAISATTYRSADGAIRTLSFELPPGAQVTGRNYGDGVTTHVSAEVRNGTSPTARGTSHRVEVRDRTSTVAVPGRGGQDGLVILSPASRPTDQVLDGWAAVQGGVWSAPLPAYGRIDPVTGRISGRGPVDAPTSTVTAVRPTTTAASPALTGPVPGGAAAGVDAGAAVRRELAAVPGRVAGTIGALGDAAGRGWANATATAAGSVGAIGQALGTINPPGTPLGNTMVRAQYRNSVLGVGGTVVTLQFGDDRTATYDLTTGRRTGGDGGPSQLTQQQRTAAQVLANSGATLVPGVGGGVQRVQFAR